MLKTQYLNEKTSDTENNKFDYNTTNKMDNSNDSNFIYKFILDNANESEEIFLKKLKKQMKSIEIKNKNSVKTLSKFSESKIDKRKSNFNNKKQSLFKGPNPFRFSRDAKILMINEPIDASSIKSSSFDSQNIIISKISCLASSLFSPSLILVLTTFQYLSKFYCKHREILYKTILRFLLLLRNQDY